MAPRLEFLGYFVVLLVGVSAYLVESHLSWPLFLLIVAAHLVALRYLCHQLAKRFKFDGERKKAA
jgi:bacteriorhodopsin